VSGTAEAGTSTSVSGLTAYTTYYLHVRSVCSVGDTSAWVTSASFTTPAAIPWSETFSTATLPTGWAVSSYSGPSTVTALNSGTTSNYMYKNLYSSQPTGYFTTVNVGVVSGSEALSFRYRTANFAGPYDPPVSGSGNFVVEISTDNGATYSTLETVVNDGIAGWKNKTYDLSPYAGEVVKIKITGNWISGDYYLGFDDFQIADACTAPVAQPTSLTLSPGTTTVDGSFTAAVADGYLVVRTDGTPPTDPVDGTTYTAGQSALGGVIVASGSSTSFTATGLTPATNYSFYVYSYNNTGCVGIAYLTASPLNDNTTTTSVFVSVQSGAWEDPNTWDMNAVPSGNDVTIATTHTVTINGAAASAGIININGGGTLQVTGNTLSAIAINNTGVFTTTGGTTNLSGTIGSGITNNSAAVFGVAGGTVNLGPAGGGDRTFTNNGTLNVSSGSLTINGNYSQITATGSIIQTGGDIIVDGNAAGVLANSVPSGTYIFQVGNSSNPATPAKLNLSGGTITIVDPHASATATYSVYIYVSSHFSATGTHTFKFGDGVSTDAGGNSNGFYTYTYPGSFYALNNVTVDAGNGINRAYTHYLIANRIGGNITINSGEFFNNNGLYVNGDIVNNGIFTSQSTLYLSKYTDGSNVAGTNAQTISGTGVFRDNQTSPTANFGPVTVNNTNVSGITFAGGISSPSFRTSITVTNGKLNADVINLNGATSISLPAGTSIINTGDLIHNTLGTITVSGSGFLNVSGNFKFGNVDSREFKTGGLLVLKSTATGTGRIADITNGGVNSGNTITGSVMQERFVPAKASRKWIFLSSPLSSTVQNSWQQQIHVTGSGTGGTVCPTLSAHTNGFDATVSNAPSMYVYDASQAQGSRWASIANTNSTNVGQGVGFRVNVRGDRSRGCELLDGSQSGLVPTATTLKASGVLGVAQKNFGSFSITYPNNGVGNYVFIGNPYPSAISFSALQGVNAAAIGSTYAIYVPASSPGTYSYWDDNAGEFTGGTGYDDATGDIIANGQAVFLESSVAGNLTLNFNEELKTTETNTGYFRPARVFNEKVKVSYLQNNNKVDEVVIRYANDAGVSNTEKGKLDITSMNSGTYISSLKGGKEMVVQTRDLRTLSNDEVWLNIGATASGTYQLSFSEFENFGGTEIILKDHYTGTEQNIKQNDKYEFSVDKDNAATKGSTRFSVVFNRTVNPEYVSNIIKLYPNPASKQVTLELPQVADNSIVYNVRVTDIAGKVVMQQKVNAGTHQLTIDRLTTGTYFVEIIDSKGNRTTEKLVKN
ncbi:MAG: T9SS type A sorting domain-containing protein, partial [Chitinophagales bacterium]|nr:T9SS type A sorting domain-containing protein [Chitinophagales bacterium]